MWCYLTVLRSSRFRSDGCKVIMSEFASLSDISDGKFSLLDLVQKPSDMTVVMCGFCRIPLGNAVDWEDSCLGDELMVVKDVTNNVIIDKDQITCESPKKGGSTFHTVYCRSCSSAVGKYYRATPERLDYKRRMYCFDLSAVERYTLGTSTQRCITNEQPLTLENVEILDSEYAKCKALLGRLVNGISHLEKKCAPK